MPPAHLGNQIVRNFVRRELASLLGQDELPGEVKHEIAQLLADRRRVAFGEGVVELEHLFHQVGAQRLTGLYAIPRAPDAEVAHHRRRASKR